MRGWKLEMSAGQVCERVNEQYGANIQPCTVQNYIKAELVGQPLLKQGTPGDIFKVIHDTICNAFESFVKINQYNGKGGNNAHKMLAGKLN